MKTTKKFLFSAIIALAVGFTFNACEDGKDGINGVDGVDGTNGQNGENGQDFVPDPTIFADKSSFAPLVAISPQFNFVKAYSLISTPDVIGGNFQLAGSADGAGLISDNQGGYIYVVNCEDSYAVARVFLDENLIPTTGDYLLNSGVADFSRQCSGTMFEASIHGGSQDIFLSASENFNYDVKGINPRVTTPTPTADFGLDALGEFAWENAVPLPKDAYSGKTVIIGGDDDSSGSEGQVTMYYSTQGDADFTNGKIYVLRFKEISNGAGEVQNVTANTTYNEGSLDFGQTYDVEFVEIVNGASMTQSEMETACTAVNASQFMRVEDVDYQKGSDANGRNVFFAVTGRGPGTGTYNDWGTVYNLKLDPNNPLQGTVRQIVSGNTSTNNMDGNLPDLQSPDNICVTENFVYIQEDPNSFSKGHPAYIYQTDINGNNASKVLELIVRQDLAEDNSVGSLDGDQGEFGALIDISDKVGIPGTFILALQPHYWESDNFLSLDGHTNTNYEDKQASQIIILKGLPR